MRWKPLARLVLGAVLLGMLAALVWHQQGAGGRLQRQADSLGGAYGRDTAQWGADTLDTDSVFGCWSACWPAEDAIAPVKAVVTAVKKERKSAGRAIKTAEQRQKVAEQRLKAATPTLRAFGELESDPAGRVGLAFRAGALDLQAYARIRAGQPPTLNFSLRKEIRLF